MRSLILTAMAASLALLLVGCRQGERSTETRSGAENAIAEAPTGEGHASDVVVPGSYEDWCEEHQVAESMCTRCDASLIPAFKASGDWCDEHGLPDSQCLKHHPDLKIVRPPKPEVN
jgi:hypothetical protein